MIGIEQFSSQELKDRQFDFVIAASGYEERAPYQYIDLQLQSNRKIVISFSHGQEHPVRKKNDNIFSKNGFKAIILDGEVADISILEKIVFDIKQATKDNGYVSVYIDYSCMTKNWYAYIIYSLRYLLKGYPADIFFGYTHAEFVPYNGNKTLNKVVGPLYGHCGLSVPSKPTALIIGLGNELNRIYGLKQYFDASPYLFYSDKSYNEMYSDEIEKINSEIIEEIDKENVFKFPVNDMIYTDYLIDNLCKGLFDDYRVVIAPCGPKPFALLSMINSLKYDNRIEVWRISPGNNLARVIRRPTGLITVIKIYFS